MNQKLRRQKLGMDKQKNLSLLEKQYLNKPVTKKMTLKVALYIRARGIDLILSLFKIKTPEIKLIHLRKETDLSLHR